MPRLLTLLVVPHIVFTAAVCTALVLYPYSAGAQNAQQPFDFEACVAAKQVSRAECEILGCAQRPNLNRAQCTCIRNCAMQYVECFKQEVKAGSNKQAAQISCDIAKDQCARQCVVQHKTPQPK